MTSDLKETNYIPSITYRVSYWGNLVVFLGITRLSLSEKVFIKLIFMLFVDLKIYKERVLICLLPLLIFFLFFLRDLVQTHLQNILRFKPLPQSKTWQSQPVSLQSSGLDNIYISIDYFEPKSQISWQQLKLIQMKLLLRTFLIVIGVSGWLECFLHKLDIHLLIHVLITKISKIPKFHLISWCETFAETHSFHRVSCDSLETLLKL